VHQQDYTNNNPMYNNRKISGSFAQLIAYSGESGPLFLLLSFSFQAISQQHHTRQLTIHDGLPSNKIRDIYKDSRGFIWIGTSAGLTLYDGNHFKTYTTDDGLAGNRVWSIDEDAQGNLWLGCYGEGISKFDGQFFTNYSERYEGLLIGTSYVDTTLDYKWLQVTSFIETDSVIYFESADNQRMRVGDRIFMLNAQDTLTYNKALLIRRYKKKQKFRYDPDGSYERCQRLIQVGKYSFEHPYKTKDSIIPDGSLYSPNNIIAEQELTGFHKINEDRKGSLWVNSSAGFY